MHGHQSSRGSGSCASGQRWSSATEASCADALRGSRRALRDAAVVEGGALLPPPELWRARRRARDGYYFWLLRDGEETIVVDCGFDPEAGRAARADVPVRAAGCAAGARRRARGGLHGVVTHLHYDHIGNLAAFPAATLCVPARELDFWTGPMASALPVRLDRRAGGDRLRGAAPPQDGFGRLEAREEICDGVTAITVGGHSPGQQSSSSRARRRRRAGLGRRALLGGARAGAAVRRRPRPRGMYAAYDLLKGFARAGASSSRGTTRTSRALPGRADGRRRGGPHRMKGRERG